MEKILNKSQLNNWIAALNAWKVFAPIFQDGIWSYQLVQPGTNPIQLDHPNTTPPPKNFSFPQREVFFTFEKTKGEIPHLTQILPNDQPQVIFGVRPCDGQALPRMDRIFTEQYTDIYYQTRRANLAYVGLACNTPPNRNCFCKSVGGSPFSTAGLDILMIDIGDRYLVATATDLGVSLINQASALFTEPSGQDRADAGQLRIKALQYPQRALQETAQLPIRLKEKFASPLWEELARPCIGCGICTYLCPTCHCFDINDEIAAPAPLRGTRIRTWDTCQFPDFTMHSSGHNPRSDVGARLRQRVCHKLQYFYENFGMFQCTGCGRCISKCPVGIDIIAVANQISSIAEN